MTVEQLDKEKLLISLGCDDLRELSLSFDSLDLGNKEARGVIMSLLKNACTIAGVASACKTMVVEALPCDTGCLLLVTLKEKEGRRRYKIKQPGRSRCFAFISVDALLSCAQRLCNEGVRLCGNSLWLYKDKYYLVLDCPVMSERACRELSEYADRFSATRVLVSRIKESGRLICDKNAMQSIGESVGKNMNKIMNKRQKIRDIK